MSGSCNDLAVIERALTRAVQGDEGAFRELTDPYRRELQLHCYRMLGSMQDAEDILQETLIGAWRGLEGFERRASLRAWLYRIATNRCLNALRDARRRPPVWPAFPFPVPEATRVGEPVRLEPCPDEFLASLADAVPGPDARYEARESLELAFITAPQELTGLQRAALVLRDVLGFRASEVAEMLGTSEESVKGGLKRARAALDERRGTREPAPPAGSPAERDLVRRFADAFAADDVEGIVALLTDDAWLTMPPAGLAYQGRVAIAAFLSALFAWAPGSATRLLATRANGQPAFACYDVDGPSGLVVFSLAGAQIDAVTRFLDGGIQMRFGLPPRL